MSRNDDLTVVPYSTAGWSVVLQNPSGHVVLFNRRNNEIQLGTNAYPATENLDRRRSSAEGVCPTCHRPLEEEANSHPPPFMDSEYFQLLGGMRQETARPSVDELPSANRPEPTRSNSLPESTFNQGYFERFFVVQSELGRGARGVVLKVTHVLDNIPLGDYAVKRVAVGDNHEYLHRMLQEVHVLRLRHRNLVNFHHVWLENSQLSPFGPPVPTLYLLQEYCDGGDLENYILSRVMEHEPTIADLKAKARRRSRGQATPPKFEPKDIPVDMVYSFTRDIVAGLNHLHKNGIIHRDLKPGNCLVSLGRGGTPRVLVGDFGEGHVEGSGKVGTGTIEYTAPELVKKTRSPRALSTKADMFSLGMVIYFMAFRGKLPYIATGDTPDSLDELRLEVQTFQGYKKDDRRTDLPDELHELLRLLLSRNPEQRPTCQEVLNLMTDRNAWQPRNGSNRFTRIDSDTDISQAARVLRRRLMGPGPTPLRNETEIDTSEGEITDDVEEEYEDDGLALVSTNSRTPPTQIDVPAQPTRLLSIDGRPGLWTGVAIGLFIVKVMSLFRFCSPYLPSATIMWLLLALAGADILLPRAPRRTAFFFLAHLIILSLASQYNFLCPHNPSPLFIQS